QKLGKKISNAANAFRTKGIEFSDVIKMGRTQLQDAVPMTLGQEFEAYAVSIEKDIKELYWNAEQLLSVNMGGTAIGTGLNAPLGYREKCIGNLAEITGLALTLAEDLVES